MPERFCRLTAMFLRRSLAEGLASRHSNMDRRVQAVIEPARRSAHACVGRGFSMLCKICLADACVIFLRAKCPSLWRTT